MSIFAKSFQTDLEQYGWIANQIESLVQQGTDPCEIAILAYRHRTLMQVLPALRDKKIPIYYEKGENILEKPYIRQLIQILKFINSIAKKGVDEADFLLPEILSFPFWGLSGQAVWELAVKVAEQNKGAKFDFDFTWLQLMDTDGLDSNLPLIKAFFLELANKAETERAESVLDLILGVEEHFFPETTDEETSNDGYKPSTATTEKLIAQAEQYQLQDLLSSPDPAKQAEAIVQEIAAPLTDLFTVDMDKPKGFRSPFKSYYFDKYFTDELAERKVNYDYIGFLSNLRVLMDAVRTHFSKEVFKVSELINFIDLVEKNKIPLIDTSPYNNGEKGVNLMTVHKSKGLEFEHVFIINCQQEEWAGKRNGVKLGFPKNLELLPEADDIDDKLRLFFVSVTRAKQYLYLTSFDMTMDGKESSKLGFLDIEWKPVSSAEIDVQQLLSVYIKSPAYPDLTHTQRELLQASLNNYQLSVTHLNNFLDITHGGPWTFLEMNLLRFPQSKPVQASYGTAMHATVASMYTELKKQGKIPELADLQHKFELFLKQERLIERDYNIWLQDGYDKLERYYKFIVDKIDPSSRIEQDFRTQDVRLGEARITGKIDKMDINEAERLIRVTDFKTGKSYRNWDRGNESEKIKLWKYRQQLLFYKLMVENSRDFGGKYEVDRGALEFLETKPDYPEVVILEAGLNKDDAEVLQKLIEAVYSRIITLDFPRIDRYDPSLDGIKHFVDDLLEGKV
ncbi:MAG: hypothetical protein OHK0017_00440 [Patescibacteria group bacterium]